MDAIDVHPEKWFWDTNYPMRVLYDDGEYSFVWGKYEGNKALGARWNISEDGSPRGYPGRGEYPTWYIEPNFITRAILTRLQGLATNPDYIVNIRFALEELED